MLTSNKKKSVRLFRVKAIHISYPNVSVFSLIRVLQRNLRLVFDIEKGVGVLPRNIYTNKRL